MDSGQRAAVYTQELRRASNEGRRAAFGQASREIASVCECDRASCFETVLLDASGYDGMRPGRSSPRSTQAEKSMSDSDAMDFRIEFGADPPADVTVTTSGKANAPTFVMMHAVLVADERFVPGMSVLVDHSALDTSTLSFDDLREIARAFEGLGDRIGRADIAIVAPRVLAWGQARQSITLAEETLARMRVVRSKDDALRWFFDE